MKRFVTVILFSVVLVSMILTPMASADNVDFSLSTTLLHSGRFNSMLLDGMTGYAFNAYGIRSFDIADPSNPVPLGLVATPGLSYGGALAGNYIIVADAFEGLSVVEATDPAAMNFISNLDLGGNCRDLEVSGDYAYCAADAAGLVIVNIGDPYNPQIESSLVLDDAAYQLEVEGGYAFIAAGTAGLVIVDVTVPSSPGIVSSLPIPLPDPAYGIAVNLDENLAAIANGASGLTLIDITDLNDPALIMTAGTLGTAVHVAFSDLYAVVSEYESGIEIFDFTGMIAGQY
ncbi:MAG TPA: hypothetical protein ENF16_02470, partial [Bacteroidetes bacterium]|nr:hypothetical protein [Bacteroidota bacterium]